MIILSRRRRRGSRSALRHEASNVHHGSCASKCNDPSWHVLDRLCRRTLITRKRQSADRCKTGQQGLRDRKLPTHRFCGSDSLVLRKTNLSSLGRGKWSQGKTTIQKGCPICRNSGRNI